MSTRIEKLKAKHTWMDQFSGKSKAIISVHILLIIVILWINDLDYSAKIALFAFLSAMILWVTTKIPAGYVALALIAFIIIMKAAEPELLYHSLSEEVVWLMIGSFIIGEAVKQSGLARRITLAILRRTTSKNNILLSMTSVLFTSAFFVPSTSGRAAMAMPIINQLGQKFSRNEKSVLAILAPVIILMSTSATLIGAGSHLIGVSLLESTVGESISYIQWFIWGVPFAMVITLISYAVINWMLWPKDGTRQIENIGIEEQADLTEKMNSEEKKTLILLGMLIVGWMTEGIHGYPIAFVTMVGAVIVMLPGYGILNWKTGMKSVSWNLIIFIAAATALGRVLVDTGVVAWIEKEMLSVLQLFVHAPEWLIVFIILLVTVTSHLYITSHTTRAIVFIPSLLLFSETIGVDPTTVVFLSLLGMNYCVTVPVSSKALLLFYEEGEISYDAKQLIKISLFLMPLYIVIMMLFYFTYWQWMGMQL
ncbi:SLC13 family permease [Lysinibacillus sp. 54212]|uniref:SLC13 family permease n=1 Tax=Lysinibacillus sp. 54212 TaxID=3119829 RepID=UPI002FC83D19